MAVGRSACFLPAKGYLPLAGYPKPSLVRRRLARTIHATIAILKLRTGIKPGLESPVWPSQPRVARMNGHTKSDSTVGLTLSEENVRENAGRNTDR
jgi:hypothetical protein